jgi:hypothetical protein
MHTTNSNHAKRHMQKYTKIRVSADLQLRQEPALIMFSFGIIHGIREETTEMKQEDITTGHKAIQRYGAAYRCG